MLTKPLPQLVTDYLNLNITAYNSELNAYNSVNTLDELLERSIYSDYRLKFNSQKSHQYCISNSSLSDMLHYCKITKVKTDLLLCMNFEELLKALYYPRKINLITGFGSICIFDSCLRFGLNTSVTLNPITGAARSIILPTYVYIHNGSENGAKNLFRSLNFPYNPKYHAWDINNEFPYFEQSYFPSPLNTLSPHHIENFLCIYEDQL